MNDEAKEILISLVDYHDAAGTKKDPGPRALEQLASRAQKALDSYSKTKNVTSASIDPFQSEFDQYEFNFKDETEW